MTHRTAGAYTLDDAQGMRQADAELLSLALIDARNHSLRWLAAFERHAAAGGAALAPADDVEAPLWLAGHAGWFQEFWIGRHVQRQRGEGCDPAAPRLASIEPRADAWYEPARVDRAQRWQSGLDGAASVRAYLAETLETTLDLLAAADPGDAALHFFRLALLHEDRIGEAMAVTAQAMQLDAAATEAPWAAQPARPERAALWLPAQRFMLGSQPGGLVPCNERWAHEVLLPEFEIDAQAVSWARYVEFAEDGGYDERRWWSEPGWAWAQAQGRRAPRYVEQLRQGVLVQRQGRLQRVSAAQAAVHVSRFEAEAWCRWAGRRLPTEVEWEAAACTAGARGFVWGDVFEWTGGSARGWPGHAAAPGDLDRLPAGGSGVLRGGSWMTRTRCKHPKARRFAAPDSDAMFCGFRSCPA